MLNPSTPSSPGKKRRPYRRDAILEAAIRLFNERGYHATGMDEIGAAAGITGPGIYRHFKNKEDILDTAVREGAGRSLANINRIVEEDGDPRAMLRALLHNFVQSMLEQPALVALSMRERRVLSKATRTWLERAERMHIEEWIHALAHMRPGLTDAEARMTVHAAFGLCMSVTHYRSGLDDEHLGALLEEMAWAALTAPGQPAVRPARVGIRRARGR